MSKSKLEELLSWHAQQDKGFCFYSWPNDQQVSFTSGTNKLDQKDGFLFQPFDKNSTTICLSEEYTRASDNLEQLLKLIALVPEEYSVSTTLTATKLQSTTKESYTKAYQAIQTAISKKEVKKVILSKIETVNFDLSKVLALFSELLKQRPETMCYCFYHPLSGLWIGATPELVIRKTKAGFRTSSIAGTKENEDINWGDKELEEQKIVTDFISNEMIKKGAVVNIGDLKTVKAGNVYHLKQLIDCELNNANLLNVVDVLHPTPAISGFPKETALAIIDQIESHSRKYYCGILGRITKEEARVYVNLRCAEITADSVAIYTGGGITKDSKIEAEWLECSNKAQGIKSLIDHSIT